MRSYVIITGVIFALVTLIHVWRMVEEPHLFREPWFLLLTAVTAAISLWSWRVAGRKPQS